MTQDELNVILEKHEKWLNNEDGGERADLSYENLSFANLDSANLSFANLSFANLDSANLSYANLDSADLSYANLSDADLRNASTQNIRGFEIYSIDNIGTFNGKVIYIPKYDKVFAGCWEGTLEEFLEKGLEMNSEDERELKNIELAYEFFKNNSEVREVE